MRMSRKNRKLQLQLVILRLKLRLRQRREKLSQMLSRPLRLLPHLLIMNQTLFSAKITGKQVVSPAAFGTIPGLL